MLLNEQTFSLYAAKNYDTSKIVEIEEFEEDLKRFFHLRKLFSRYKQVGELKERLILNHLIIIYNCFGPAATHMLFMKLEQYQEFLKPFVEYLNYMPEFIEYNNLRIHKSKINSDDFILKKLKNI